MKPYQGYPSSGDPQDDPQPPENTPSEHEQTASASNVTASSELPFLSVPQSPAIVAAQIEDIGADDGADHQIDQSHQPPVGEAPCVQPQNPEPRSQRQSFSSTGSRPEDPEIRWIAVISLAGMTKLRIAAASSRARTFNYQGIPSREAVSTIDQMINTINDLSATWQNVWLEMSNVAAIAQKSVAEQEMVQKDNEMIETLYYLKNLRSYVTSNQLDETETTFHSTRIDAPSAPSVPVLSDPIQAPLSQEAPTTPRRTPQLPEPDAVRGTHNYSLRSLRNTAPPTPLTSFTQARSEEQTTSTARLPPKPPGDSPTAPPENSSAAFPSQPPGGLNLNTSQSPQPRDDQNKFLPKLCNNVKLPKFSGDVKQYREFSEIFNTFVDKRDIPILQKMVLLKESLLGRALNSVKHLSFLEANYEVMKEILQETYGQQDLAESSHLAELDRILSTGGELQYDKLPLFVSQVSQHIYALITLGHTYHSLSAASSNKILNKLTYIIKHKAAEHIQANRSKPKLEALLAFLRSEAATVESLREAGHSSSSFSRGRYGSRQRENRRSGEASGSTGENPASYKKTSNAYHVGAPQFPSRDVPDAPHPKQKFPCILCDADHPAFRCTATLTPEERKERVQKAKGCTKCLKRNHEARACSTTMKDKCQFCSGAHYSIICKNAPADFSQARKSSKKSSMNLNHNASEDPVYLWTALVVAKVGNTRVPCRILIDPGSQSTHLTEALASKLHSKPSSVIDLTLATAGGKVSSIYNCGVHHLTLVSRHDSSKSIDIKAVELKCLSRSTFPVMKGNHGLSPIADAVTHDGQGLVDILLGADYLTKIGFEAPHAIGNIFAFNCIFGWVLGGSAAAPSDATLPKFCGFESVQPGSPILPSSGPSVISSVDPLPKARSVGKLDETTTDLQFLWQSEDIGVATDAEQEKKEEQDDLNKALELHFRKTISRDASGRYTLRLPFKENIRSLGDNENLTRSRLHSFISKLRKDPNKLKAVDDELANYIQADFAENAPPREPGQLVHYLPLQAVFKQSPSAPLGLKTRVVKDASARRSNESGLNDVLHCGPNLLPDITKVLMKFRQYRYAITCDIEKAFLQFMIAEPDRNFLRFLWPLGISANPSAKTREFRAKRLDFGLICSPYLHCMGLKYHLEQTIRKRPKDEAFIREILGSYYMDDLVGGHDNLTGAKNRIRTLFEIFGEAGFPLKKWSSNSPELCEYVADTSPVPDPIITSKQENTKFLGVPWNQITDTLSAPTTPAIEELSTGEPTKRRLLKGLAKIFDPLGIIAPVTINAKILFQKLWKAKVNWDDALPEQLQAEYINFLRLLKDAASFAVPRQAFADNPQLISRQLHGFCDASGSAYGCVFFLRESFKNAKPRVSFLLAKAKVAPVKPMSIARLELHGALLAARVLKKLHDTLPFEPGSTHLYCDNSSVLAWVASDPESWKPYVANRIRKIHALIGRANWTFIPSAENVSDILSRGSELTPQLKATWFKGPKFLHLADTEMRSAIETNNRIPSAAPNSELDGERKLSTAAYQISSKSQLPEPTIFFERSFSTWLKAVRFWAFMRRLKEKARQAKLRVATGSRSAPKAKHPPESISPEEMIEARMDLLKLIQSKHFPHETSTRCSKLKSSSPLFQYSPFMGDDNLIRCRSRLEYSSELSDLQKFPIILPSGGNLTTLIIRDIHERKCFHSGGMAAVLHALRQEFLVIHARKLVRRIMSSCTLCKIFHNPAAQLPTAALPQFRVDSSPPFQNSGCDFFGPVRYRNHRGEIHKGYVLLFTCAVTRAVNLYLTTDMSTAEVLGALQKFVNRYGAARTITSDNGTSFRRAAKELKIIHNNVLDESIRRWLADNFLTWSYLPAASPSFGGFYERQVQTIKRPLRKVLGSAIPYFRDLEVILSSIEAMANRRPITPVAAGADSTEALSPSDLLYGYRGHTIFPQHSLKPKTREEETSVVFSKRWCAQQRILNAFWKRFYGEYLSYLRSAHNRLPVEARPLKVGDVCLLEDIKTNRGLWPLCRVIGFPDNRKPENSRACIIKTARGQIFTRPIKKLFPIETSPPAAAKSNSTAPGAEAHISTRSLRKPQRAHTHTRTHTGTTQHSTITHGSLSRAVTS